MSNISTIGFKLAERLKEGLKSNIMSNDKDITNYVISTESFNPESQQLYASRVSEIEDVVTDAIAYATEALSNAGISTESYTEAQKNAARMISVLALNPSQTLNKLSTLEAAKDSVAPYEIGVEDYVPFAEISTEAYDGQKKDNAFLYSVVYNFIASKQDEFGETFYPTTLIDALTSGIDMEIKFASLMNEVVRPIDGRPNGTLFNKIPLPKAIYDSDIFSTDRNRLFPVHRDNNVNDEWLLVSESRVDESTLEKVKTAPLLFGKKIGLLSISQTDSQLAKGVQDNTDALDRTITLQTLYATLENEDASVSETFKLDVSGLGFNQFIANPQAHNKDMLLNFSGQQVLFDTTETKTSKGTTSQVLSALPEGYIVYVTIGITGEANTQYGDVELNVVKAVVSQIRNKAGDLIAESESEYKTIIAAFNKLKLVAYDLEAYSTNSNLRKRGQLLTVDIYKQPYMVPNRSGFMYMVPINNANGIDNDTDPIIAQAQVAGAKISSEAVTTLIKHINFMKYITNDGTREVTNEDAVNSFKGVGKYILNFAYAEDSVELQDFVSSIDSNTRDEAIRAAIIQKIYNMGMNLYLKSNYGVVFEKILTSSSSARPLLIVGTDPNIKRLLLLDNNTDVIKTGSVFDIKVVSTFNKLVTGKIILSFGSNSNDGTPNPLNHGTLALAPSLVYNVTRTVGNSTSTEVQNNPRFAHITNLPIAGIMHVSGIEQVFGQIPFKMIDLTPAAATKQ